jgi:hypothetical protein
MNLPSSSRLASGLWPTLLISLFACQQGGQSGDLNHDALDRTNGEDGDDVSNEPEPAPRITDGGPSTPSEPEPSTSVDEPEPTVAGEPEPEDDVPTDEPSVEPTPLTPEPAVEPTPITPTPVTPTPVGPPAATDGGVPDAQCSNLDYESLALDGSEVGFDGVRAIAFYGDGKTTLCAAPSLGKLCLSGVASSSGDDYVYWGSGLSLLIEPAPGEPRDLETLGVTAAGLALTDVRGRPVRVALHQVDDPEITDPTQNFEQNAFYFGGSAPNGTTMDAELVIAFSQFVQPSWTLLVDPATGESAEGLVVDPSRLKGLLLQISNNPDDLTTTYGFCVSGIEWHSAAGTLVDLPEESPAADAGVPLE